MRRRTKTPQVGLAYFLLASSLPAQKEVFVPANDVSFTLSAERPTYRSGEQITLKYKITNISNTSLYVPQEWEVMCPAGPHVWAWFEDGSGQHFIPGYDGSCSESTNPKTVSERMNKEAVLLKLVNSLHVDVESVSDPPPCQHL